MERDLSRGGIVRTVLAFGLPLAFGMAAHASFNLVDLWIVGELGEDAVAAVHLGSTINFFPMIVGNGLSVGVVAIVSRLLGAGRRGEAGQLANFAALLMLGLGLLLGGLCALYATELIALQSGDGASGDAGEGYLVVVSWGTFTMFGLMHLTGLLRAMGNASWTLFLMLGSNALNIALDYAFIFGWEALGIPAMGAVGAAWASVLARGIFTIVGLLVLMRRDSPLRPGLRMPRALALHAKEIVRLGLPQSVQMFVRASLVVTVTRLAGELGGRSAQAALSVATRLDTVVLFAAVGWAGAATAMVGQSSARALPERCHRLTWTTVLFAAGAGLAVGLIFVVYSDAIYRVFVPGGSEAYFREGRRYFEILAFAHPAASATLVLAGAWNGVGVSVRPMLFDLVFYGLLLQPALFVWQAAGASGGLAWCWIAVLLANWLLLVAYAVAMRRSAWARALMSKDVEAASRG